ncbi:MAG: hypothetical protein ABWJ42_05885 [Sulfolobales archaeon]
MNERGFRNRSAGVQEALRDFIASHKVRYDKESEALGVIVIYYDHEVHELDERLIDVQHEYLDIIISMQHVHLTKRYCTQILVARGVVSRIESLIRDIGKLKISYVKYIIMPILEK